MSGGRGDPVFFLTKPRHGGTSFPWRHGMKRINSCKFQVLGGFKDCSNLEEMMYLERAYLSNKMVQPPTWCVCVFGAKSPTVFSGWSS